MITNYKGIGDLSGRDWSRIKYSAKKRNIEFSDDLTIDFAWQLFLDQNKKCKLSNLPIELYRSRIKNTASLDRIDSSGIYSKDNVQWLHKDINNLKGSLSNKDTIDLCRRIYINNSLNIPSWPEYFINMAYMVSSRSKDPSTKCGCVITDSDYRVISTGYNGSFQGIDDNMVSWERPKKYEHITHSEMNAILFARESLKGCYAFITGVPCSNCTKHMIQAGIIEIHYGNNLAVCCNTEDFRIVRELCKLKNVKLIQHDI